MNPLTSEERDKLARHLAYNATAGGWFLLFMATFVLIIFTLPYLGILNFDRWEPELIGAFIPFLLAFAVPGWWLINRRKHTRTMLDDPLLTGTAEIIHIDHTDPSSGWYVTLRVKTPSHTETESTLQSYAQPSWEVGEQIELLFTEDERRYFPRDLSHNANFGRIYTIDEKDANRRWGLVIGFIIGGLFLMGIIIGIYSDFAATP